MRVQRRSGIWGLVVAAVLAAACAAPVPVGLPEGQGDVVVPERPDSVGPLRQRGGELVDAHGRVVQLRGINMVNKRPPHFVPAGEPWLGEQQLADLWRNGFNAVRLGVWPAALMPAPGVVDHAYLDAIAQTVELLGDHGIWVLLDLHQDVWSGLPQWAVTPEAAALSDLPTEVTDLFWGLSYFSPRSMRQWEDLYGRVPVHDGRSAVDLMGEGYEALAERFVDTEHLVGIDLLNEPWPGERFFDCLVGGCGARYVQLQSIYAEWTERIRSVAPDTIVWWAPYNWGPPFQGSPSPGPGIGYTFHSYCLGTDAGEPEQPDVVSNTLCRAVYDGNVGDALAVGRRWDAPVLLGEFGASASPLNTTRLTELADHHHLSWLYWDNFYLAQAPDVVLAELFRPSPQALAGTPTLQRYDPASGSFELRYRPDAGAGATSSVVVPGAAYPDGYTVDVQGATVRSEPDAGVLRLAAEPGATEVRLRLARARR